MKAADVITEHELYIRKIIHARVWDGFEDDIFQNIALAVVKSLPTLRDDAFLKTWLTRVIYNQIAQHTRNQYRWVRNCACMAEQYETIYLPDDHSSLVREEVFGALTDKQRVVLELFLDGWRFNAISEKLGLPYEQVRSRYRRVVERLQKLYSKEIQ